MKKRTMYLWNKSTVVQPSLRVVVRLLHTFISPSSSRLSSIDMTNDRSSCNTGRVAVLAVRSEAIQSQLMLEPCLEALELPSTFLPPRPKENMGGS